MNTPNSSQIGEALDLCLSRCRVQKPVNFLLGWFLLVSLFFSRIMTHLAAKMTRIGINTLIACQEFKPCRKLSSHKRNKVSIQIRQNMINMGLKFCQERVFHNIKYFHLCYRRRVENWGGRFLEKEIQENVGKLDFFSKKTIAYSISQFHV